MKVITVISVGSKPNTALANLIHVYMRRLPKHIHIQWRFVKHGDGSPIQSKQQETEKILSMIDQKSTLILLDEHGKQYDSVEFSHLIFDDIQNNIIFVIGGAYGVSTILIKRANYIWSLGSVVFPHQLVRVLLAEQIYRAHTIASGHPYHHE